MVISSATSGGTPTSEIEMFGSGDMTVRAEKLTRFPDRLYLKRPSFPFSLCERVLSGLPDLLLMSCASGLEWEIKHSRGIFEILIALL
jgi:hypothetical protein